MFGEKLTRAIILCVTPAQRARAKADNSSAGGRYKYHEWRCQEMPD
jgi:hypothetical protein